MLFLRKSISLIFLLLVFAAHGQQQDFSITSFGATGDGVTMNTKPVQAAVDACNKNGGGRVVVPPGIFIIGTVHLKSHVHLYLEKGGVLKGSADLKAYEIFIPDSPFQPVHKGMLFAEDAEDITISGDGQIDGNGDVFFDFTKAKTIPAAGSGGTAFTRQKDNYRKVSEGIGDGPGTPKDRPYQMFVFSNCKRITVRNIFITSAPFWCMLFADCDAVNISGIRLWNNLLAPNADGIDIASCTNVKVTNCDIRAGDDAIAIVGYNHHFEIPGFKHLHHISENIIVGDCNLQSYSSGIRIGYLDQNTVRNVQVSNCTITNSTRGIGIFVRDEGSLENLSFNNIFIQTVLRTGDWWGNGEPIHISAVSGNDKVKLGKIKNVSFTGITCKSENGILLYGSEKSQLENISFNGLNLELAESKLNGVAGGNIDLRGALGDKQIYAHDIPAFYAQYVKGLSIENFRLDWGNAKASFFTHGIEVTHFNDLLITHFNGTASPFNKKAFPVFVNNGVGAAIFMDKGVKKENIGQEK